MNAVEYRRRINNVVHQYMPPISGDEVFPELQEMEADVKAFFVPDLPSEEKNVNKKK